MLLFFKREKRSTFFASKRIKVCLEIVQKLGTNEYRHENTNISVTNLSCIGRAFNHLDLGDEIRPRIVLQDLGDLPA